MMNDVQHTNKNGFAIASLVISLVGLIMCFLFIPQILGIIFGIIGLKSEKRGQAIAGLVISSITIIVAVFITFAIAIPNILNAIDEAREASTITIDKEIEIEHEFQEDDEIVMETFFTDALDVSLEYDTSVWEALNGDEKGIGLITNSPGTYDGKIICKEYSEILTEDHYIEMLIEVYQEHEVKDSTYVEKLEINGREYSIIHSKHMEGEWVVCTDVLIVFNGITQYEFTFFTTENKYNKNFPKAMKVFETLQILIESREQVIDDPDLAKSMEALNNLAGIDTQSVLDNVSQDGKELIGAWGYENTTGGVDIVLVINSDGTYKRYYQYPDESTMIAGTWRYDGNRSLYFTPTSAFENGVDVMDKVDANQIFEIYYFKDDIMRLMNLKTLNEFEYKKSDR